MAVSKEQESQAYSLQPKVVIVVLNWNGRENTHECLNSLIRIDYKNYEIIVVDNDSTDGSQKFLKNNFPEIALIENKRNLGFGGGLNVGIREAIKRISDYVLCLNNDVVVDKNILNELVKIGELGTKIGGLCPMEYDYYQPDRIICAGGIIRFVKGKLFGYGKLDRGQFNKVMTTGLLSGPAMMIKIQAILDVGFFDTSYFYGPEDKDIALRLMKGGYRLMFAPAAKVWHKKRGATGGSVTSLTVYFEVRNYLLFAKKHANNLERFFSILYLGLLEFPLLILKGFLGCKRQYISAAINGVLWNFSPVSVPTDSKMVQLLSHTEKEKSVAAS